MGHLFNRRVLLAIGGGIAAYKAAEVLRGLQERGAEVRVLMTRGAQEFITPLTLQALSGYPVHHSLLDEEAERAMGHIELARWADLVLVAPATADCLARLVAGRADDLLGAVTLATASPLLLAPAMNQQMWRNAATQDNLKRLQERGFHIVGPAEGEQACGDVGPGRLMEPPRIVDAAASCFGSRLLDGQRVVITAGPTREALDPVRFLSNHSSGRMGFAIARAAAEAGAATTLIAGPVELPTPERVARRDVVSALDMLQVCEELAPSCDIFIGCAAVADYRPVSIADHKIKKSAERIHLELERNPDIVATIAARPSPPYMVGFAAETQRLQEHARAKLEAKSLDLILANDVSDPSIGFNADENAGWLLWEDGEREFKRCSKNTLAGLLVEEIARRLPVGSGESAR